jgi:hypothetical protein
MKVRPDLGRLACLAPSHETEELNILFAPGFSFTQNVILWNTFFQIFSSAGPQHENRSVDQVRWATGSPEIDLPPVGYAMSRVSVGGRTVRVWQRIDYVRVASGERCRVAVVRQGRQWATTGDEVE